MSHRHLHPIILTGIVVVAGVWWFAHGKAQDDNRFRTEKAQVVSNTFGFSDLGTAKRFYYLTLVANDQKASDKLMETSYHAHMMTMVEKGKTVSVDNEEAGDHPYLCLRPFGDPDCYWAPAFIAFGSDKGLK